MPPKKIILLFLICVFNNFIYSNNTDSLKTYFDETYKLQFNYLKEFHINKKQNDNLISFDICDSLMNNIGKLNIFYGKNKCNPWYTFRIIRQYPKENNFQLLYSKMRNYKKRRIWKYKIHSLLKNLIFKKDKKYCLKSKANDLLEINNNIILKAQLSNDTIIYSKDIDFG